MKKVLITGATGLLGTSLTAFLIKTGYNVYTHSLHSNSDFKGDLSGKAFVYDMIKKIRPEVIINLVALTDVDECERNLKKAYLINVKPVENIVSWIKANQQVDLIHISTDHVYDGQGPHKEDDVCLTNVYALTKFCAELVALQVDGVVLRTNFFGESTNPERKSFSDWLIEVLAKKKPVTLFSDVYFSPLSLESLQHMIGRIVNSPRSGIYNLGSRDGMSKRDFAHTLASHLSLSISLAKDGLSTEAANLTYRPKDMRMDISLFEKTFAVQLPTLLKEIQTLRRPS